MNLVDAKSWHSANREAQCGGLRFDLLNDPHDIGFDLLNEGVNPSNYGDVSNDINLINNDLIVGRKYENKVSIPTTHGKSNDINLVNNDLIAQNKNRNKVSNNTVHGKSNHIKMDLIIENRTGNKVSNFGVHGVRNKGEDNFRNNGSCLNDIEA